MTQDEIKKDILEKILESLSDHIIGFSYLFDDEKELIFEGYRKFYNRQENEMLDDLIKYIYLPPEEIDYISLLGTEDLIERTEERRIKSEAAWNEMLGDSDDHVSRVVRSYALSTSDEYREMIERRRREREKQLEEVMKGNCYERKN